MVNSRCCVLRGCGCVEGAREDGLPPPPPRQAVQVDTASGCLGTWYLGNSGALGLAPGRRVPRAPPPLTLCTPSHTDQGEDGPCSGAGTRPNQSPVHARHFWSQARARSSPVFTSAPHVGAEAGRARASGPGQGGSRFLVAPSGKAASATAAQRGRAHSFTSRRWSAGL